MTTSPARSRPRLLGLSILAALPALGAGTALAQAAPAATALTVTLRAFDAPDAPATHWGLGCGTGRHGAHHRALCTRLAGPEAARILTPTPCPGAASDEYEGPQVLLVTGTLAGHRVRLTLRRTNSWERARWNDVVRLLGISLDPPRLA